MTQLITEVEAVVREVGARLAGQQGTEPTAARTRDEAFAAFRELDQPATELLRERLGPLRPQAGWLDDELDSALPADGEWWSCDATDGAVQYLLGLPHWAVTATLLREGEAVLAVVHAPRLDACYTAVRGAGARLNGCQIRPSERELNAAVVATSHPPTITEDPAALRRVGATTSAVIGAGVLAVRNLGPTALQVAQVGSGHLDAFWECGLDAPNLLPGALIAAEAGAKVTDHAGEPWRPSTSTGFLAAPMSQHEALVRVLSAAI
ncbi:inositol monophosphatase family protein [Kitasatospora kifunensis]|uniref:Myo-inositol-1(Or 4)-monophosphatase n=1 Tax=Kitasatospora kifunensis TaxID=58351 RepID=A0A7W7R077_KITKI|nr:inositol monophosphatase family protein [Kitasatospora kifunensis]MBB4923046.1 myo-inositol-1(or 4)-monophosphatase [Kitasatospora kifunensis]